MGKKEPLYPHVPKSRRPSSEETSHSPYTYETKRILDKVVKKYNIAATDLIVYDVWEPSELAGPHSTVTTIDGRWYGRLGTRRSTSELEGLAPGSEERFRAVGKWHDDQFEEAYRLIVQAFPEASGGERSMGQISLHWSPSGGSTGASGGGSASMSKGKRPTRDAVRVEIWEERDRLHIGIQDKETGNYIASWWDNEAREMFYQGFFKSGPGLKESVLDYGEDTGLLRKEQSYEGRNYQKD